MFQALLSLGLTAFLQLRPSLLKFLLGHRKRLEKEALAANGLRMDYLGFICSADHV